MYDLVKPRKAPYTEATQAFSDAERHDSLARADWCHGEPMRRDIYAPSGFVKLRCYTCHRVVQRQLKGNDL